MRDNQTVLVSEQVDWMREEHMENFAISETFSNISYFMFFFKDLVGNTYVNSLTYTKDFL